MENDKIYSDNGMSDDGSRRVEPVYVANMKELRAAISNGSEQIIVRGVSLLRWNIGIWIAYLSCALITCGFVLWAAYTMLSPTTAAIVMGVTMAAAVILTYVFYARDKNIFRASAEKKISRVNKSLSYMDDVDYEAYDVTRNGCVVIRRLSANVETVVDNKEDVEIAEATGVTVVNNMDELKRATKLKKRRAIARGDVFLKRDFYYWLSFLEYISIFLCLLLLAFVQTLFLYVALILLAYFVVKNVIIDGFVNDDISDLTEDQKKNIVKRKVDGLLLFKILIYNVENILDDGSFVLVRNDNQHDNYRKVRYITIYYLPLIIILIMLFFSVNILD